MRLKRFISRSQTMAIGGGTASGGERSEIRLPNDPLRQRGADGDGGEGGADGHEPGQREAREYGW